MIIYIYENEEFFARMGTGLYLNSLHLGLQDIYLWYIKCVAMDKTRAIADPAELEYCRIVLKHAHFC